MKRLKKQWNRTKEIWQKFKAWQHLNLRMFRLVFASSLLAGMALLLFGTQFAPQKITVDGLTKVGDELSYSNGSGDIKLVEQKYNPAEKTMVLGFKTHRADVESSNAIPIPSKNLKFSLVTVNPEKAKMQIIPTTNDHIAVLIRNLSPKYGAMRISIVNRTPIGGSESSDDNSKENKTVDFKFKANTKNVDSSLKDMGRKDFAIAASNEEVTKQEKLIKKHKKNIDNDLSIIDSDKNNIKSQEKENQYNIKSDQKKAKETIQSLNDDIEEQKTDIKREKKHIADDQDKINLLNKQILDIQSGEYTLPKVISSNYSKNLK